MSVARSSGCCPACGSSRLAPSDLVTTARSVQAYAVSDPEVLQELVREAERLTSAYSLLTCGHCGLEFASPALAPSEAWYHLLYQAMDLYPGQRWEFDHCLARVGAEVRVLEFGCGSGSFLAQCRDRGLAAIGVDFSAAAVEQCVARGLEARHVDINCSHVPGSTAATCLVAFHVLEHLAEPVRLFELALAFSSRDAELWVSVPSPRRATRLLRTVDVLDRPPHHLTRWTEEAMLAIGRRAGWRLESVAFEPITVKSALWAITTASRVYRRAASALHGRRAVERSLRWALYPWSLWGYVLHLRHMTGFSMLVRYRRSERGYD